MKLGVKVGPLNWKEVLPKITPQCAEVWFKLDVQDQFGPIYQALHDKHVPFGIHFWATTKDGYEPNLAYDRDGIARQSSELMKETIDIAHANGASYVNVHPGSLSLKQLDFEEKTMNSLPETKVPEQEGYETLKKHVLALTEYAKSKNILFLVETLPSSELAHFRDESGREDVRKSDNIQVDMLTRLAHDGAYITNDFGHTLANWVSEDRDMLYEQLYNASAQLALYTKLVHINTVRPPFNGTDSHDGVQDSDFANNVLPTKAQMKKLIALYKKRDDVWLIPEPQPGAAIANYKALCSIVDTL